MAPPRAAPHTGSMPAQTIFVVEDAPLVRERLLELLGAVPGARVVGHAARADEAIHDILAERPDVVVLDLRLAQGSGFDVLRAVHEAAPEIDCYMLSSFATEPYRRLAARLGARDFFDKTTEFERVRDIIAARSATKH
jgi:DNA-binding NarL/FixJ family response regulator